jgi:hypothetical protein
MAELQRQVDQDGVLIRKDLLGPPRANPALVELRAQRATARGGSATRLPGAGWRRDGDRDGVVGDAHVVHGLHGELVAAGLGGGYLPLRWSVSDLVGQGEPSTPMQGLGKLIRLRSGRESHYSADDAVTQHDSRLHLPKVLTIHYI